ncbi:MAG TPA: hypothetical protein VIC71_14825, partial [Gammaproteobacteria bacterium]
MRKKMSARRIAPFAAVATLLASCTSENPGDTPAADRAGTAGAGGSARYTTWRTYSGGAHASQYSA